MIESTGKAAIIQVGLNFPGKGIPSGNSLWTAQAYWAYYALNSTATTRNPRCMTPYEMRYGKVPPSPFPFLKPGFVKRTRGNKLEPKAISCFYIGPSPNRPRDSMRVMLRYIYIPDSSVSSMLGHVVGEDKKPKSSDSRRWSLLERSLTRVRRTKRTSGPRGATLNQSTSRLAAVRAEVRTKNCTSSLSAPRRQLLRLLPRGGPRNRHD